MRNIEFICETGFSNCNHVEIVDISDDFTDEQIDKQYKEWLSSKIDMAWEEVG